MNYEFVIKDYGYKLVTFKPQVFTHFLTIETVRYRRIQVNGSSVSQHQ